jgi:thioredoxin 1
MREQQVKEHQMDKKTKCATFTESNFKEEVLHCGRPVLIVFRADWSGTCHIMSPILEDLCSEFEGKVKIGTIDIDNNVKLAQNYGISNIPSFVFCNNG